MATVLHLTGPILRGPEDVVPEAWVVGGRLTYEAVGYGIIVLRTAFLEHGIQKRIHRWKIGMATGVIGL